MQLTHPIAPDSDAPFKYYDHPEVTFLLCTGGPKEKVGQLTLHIDCDDKTQLLILSPADLARMDSVRDVDKLRADLVALQTAAKNLADLVEASECYDAPDSLRNVTSSQLAAAVNTVRVVLAA